MTFEEAMVKRMTSRGMFPSQAEEVITNYMENNREEYINELWHENVSGYPPAMQTTLWVGVKEYAAVWIAENEPQAWFRPMFQYSDSELAQMSRKMSANMVNLVSAT